MSIDYLCHMRSTEFGEELEADDRAKRLSVKIVRCTFELDIYMSIKHIIASLSQRSKNELKDMRNKAKEVLRKNRDDTDAHTLLQALDANEAPPGDANEAPPRRVCTGLIYWDPHGHLTHSLGRDDKMHVVAKLTKRKNHTHTADDKDIYRVEVLGEQISGGPFRKINAARDAAEAAYRTRKA